VSRHSELGDLLLAEPWFVAQLERARALELPDWYIGAGAVRDLVWDVRFGDGFDPTRIEDVDLVYFDPDDLSHEREVALERLLGERWDVKNQAAVHLWFESKFGTPATPLTSTVDGIATWPEFCTCVGARLELDGTLTIAAPHGLDDLLDGRWRLNPVRVTAEEAARRRAKKDPAARWPGVIVH
jgi:uncharacterized protein